MTTHPAQDGETASGFTEFSENYHARMFPNRKSTFRETDPDFVRALDNWAFDEVVRSDDTPDALRFKVILAALIGSGSIDEFRLILPAALNFGVTAEEAKEIVYQAFPYLGIGRAFPFLVASNDVLRSLGVALPVSDALPRPLSTRRERGERCLKEIFGDAMDGFLEKGPAETRRIRKWLVENCFGDYYARPGLPIEERELFTFCFLAAQGGSEAQLKGHVPGNLHVGNTKEKLLNAVAQILPFIGYPRALNAVDVIEEICGTSDKAD